MLLTEKTISINSRIDRVFTYVSNMENFTAWFPKVVEIKSDDNLEHGVVGKKYLETLKIPFKRKGEYPIIVKRSDENEIFVTEGDVPPILPRMTVNFYKISENKTMVTWKMESRNDNLLMKSLILPIFGKEMAKRANKGMENLKYLLENSL